MWNREKAIDAIISDDIDSIMVSKDFYNDESLIDSILRVGHKGYQDYTDDQLMEELIGRDISTVFGETE
jgi:hypothetical protein